MFMPTHDQIAAAAYKKFQERGGNDVDNWLEAQNELIAKYISSLLPDNIKKFAGAIRTLQSDPDKEKLKKQMQDSFKNTGSIPLLVIASFDGNLLWVEKSRPNVIEEIPVPNNLQFIALPRDSRVMNAYLEMLSKESQKRPGSIIVGGEGLSHLLVFYNGKQIKFSNAAMVTAQEHRANIIDQFLNSLTNEQARKEPEPWLAFTNKKDEESASLKWSILNQLELEGFIFNKFTTIRQIIKSWRVRAGKLAAVIERLEEMKNEAMMAPEIEIKTADYILSQKGYFTIFDIAKGLGILITDPSLAVSMDYLNTLIKERILSDDKNRDIRRYKLIDRGKLESSANSVSAAMAAIPAVFPYKVPLGKKLRDVADLFGITEQELIDRNPDKLPTNDPLGGETLTILTYADRFTYIVPDEDRQFRTLEFISRRMNVDRKQLANLNHILENTLLKPGDTIRVVRNSAMASKRPDQTKVKAFSEALDRQMTLNDKRPGELAKIFNVEVKDFSVWRGGRKAKDKITYVLAPRNIVQRLDNEIFSNGEKLMPLWEEAWNSASRAMIAGQDISAPGGIDLNTSNGMSWKVSKDGEGVEMDVDPAMVARIEREGINWLSPVIFKMTPVDNIWPIIGLQEPAHMLTNIQTQGEFSHV
jgi:hypothetical protein